MSLGEGRTDRRQECLLFKVYNVKTEGILMPRLSSTFLSLAIVPVFLLTACGPRAKVAGEVRDGFGSALQGVAVSVPGTQFKAVTDTEGRYEIQYAPGRFQVNFTKDGYLAKTLDFEVVTETEVPAEQVVLIKIPQEAGVYFWGAEDYVSLGSGKLEFSSVEHGFSWDQPLRTDTYRVDGEFVRVASPSLLRFVDNVPHPMGLFALDSEGYIMVRQKAWLSTKDDVTPIKEATNRLAEGIVERTAELAPGLYAFAQVSGNARLNTGEPSFGAIEGHPILEPVFLFEVAEEGGK